MSDFEIIVKVTTAKDGGLLHDITLYRRKALLDELANEGWTEKELEVLNVRLDAVTDIVIGGSSLHIRAINTTPKRANLSTGKGKKKPLPTGK